MRLIHDAKELNPGKQSVCLAIGFFDGVHLGHQQLIRQTISDARRREALALILTFDQHPNTIVAPSRVPPLIYSLPQKLRTIDHFGADALLLIHFDKVFSLQTGEQFIRSLAHDLGPLQSLCVGSDFTFGRQRSGNVQLLQSIGSELHFAVHGLAAVSLDGKAVSSTWIREQIAAGELDSASQMLGRAYSLAGAVVRGDGLGRQLGFPTANLDTSGLVLPPNGVYAVKARFDGQTYRAVLNIGRRPTLKQPEPALRVEAHLLDFDADIYGQELEVTFIEKLREEKEFTSLPQLKEQIARDIEQARNLF